MCMYICVGTVDTYFAGLCTLGTRYLLQFSSRTWWAAKDYCMLFGRRLLSLETENEVRFVRQKLLEKTDGAENYAYWVGLNDNSNEGKEIMMQLSYGQPDQTNLY